MDTNALKALTDLQKELFKTTQDQIKILDERSRAFITLASGALAAVALVTKPDVFLAGQQSFEFKLIGSFGLFFAVLCLIGAFLAYRSLALPSLIDFPNPEGVEDLSKEETLNEKEVQKIILNAYTVLYQNAYDLLVLKTRRAKWVSGFVLSSILLLVLYLVLAVQNQIF